MLTERGPLFHRVGHGGQGLGLAAAIHGDGEAGAGASGNGALHVEKVGDTRPVDGRDHVAGLESGTLRGAAWHYAIDARRKLVATDEVNRPGEKRDGEEEVGDGAGSHDRRPLTQALRGKARRTLLGRHPRQGGGIGHAGAIGVAMELDVAA